MEELLRSKEMDKIEELFNKAFNLNSNIVFFPVRHHSPACSYNLKKTIEEYNPDVILIEGLIDGNKVKKFLEDEESEAPFSMYYSYSDTKGFVSKENEKYKCYYPFLDYSPELVALREGKKRGIETSFIDLPYSEILINCKEGKGLLKKENKSNYNDDYLFESGKFFESLCEKERCRNFNELWEKLFEIKGFYISKESFVKNILSYCYLTRLNTPKEELIEEGCIAREIFMTSKIQEFSKEYKKVLVVTGGFHTYGILELLDKENKIKLHKFNKDDSKVYVMPYSMEAVDQLNGYASGMPFPNFYEEVWKGIEKNQNNFYEDSVLKFIIKTGKEVRKNDGYLSTFDEICAFNMCKGLASLREKNQCGAYELIDGITSSFIKGDLNISTEDPLKILYKNLTGNKIGKLCEKADVPPLVQDFKTLAEKYKLKIVTTMEQEIALDIFSSKRHREISSMLHRMEYLNTNFCKVKKGPNILLKRNTNLVREVWKYKWNTSVDSALIDNSVYGGTLKEATLSLVKKEIKDNAKNSGDISKILVQAFYMGLEEVFNSTILSLKDAIAEDGSFYSLIDCLKYLNSIYYMRELYNMFSMDKIGEIIFSCYSKLSILIPDLYLTNEEDSIKTVNALKEIFNVVLNRDINLDKDILKEALRSLLRAKESNPSVEGATLGILYGLNDVEIDEIKFAAEGYILGTKEKVMKVPGFLNGLFSTARDVVFIDDSILKSVDKLVNDVSEEEFIKVIPELRLAFSYFTPREIDEIGGNVSKMYGISKRKFHSLKGISPNVVSLGEELDKTISEFMKEEGLL